VGRFCPNVTARILHTRVELWQRQRGLLPVVSLEVVKSILAVELERRRR
jgi:hypothetical protein